MPVELWRCVCVCVTHLCPASQLPQRRGPHASARAFSSLRLDRALCTGQLYLTSVDFYYDCYFIETVDLGR